MIYLSVFLIAISLSLTFLEIYGRIEPEDKSDAFMVCLAFSLGCALLANELL